MPSRRPVILDELLRALVHDGLLQTDLVAAAHRAPPASYLRDRLAAIGRPAEARALDEAEAAFEAGDLARAAALSGRRSPAAPPATSPRS